MIRADGNFETFRQIVAKLRAPDGCPWDRAQTHESLKPTCIEEAAEVVCGINILSRTGSADNLKEELGDLLLQVVIQAQIAEEEGLFSIEDVIEGIGQKMIRRHPHVFGEEASREAMAPLLAQQKEEEVPEEADASENAEEVLAEAAASRKPGEVLHSWEEIKKLEKHGREWEKDYLPEAFSESQQLIERARRRKFGDASPESGKA